MGECKWCRQKQGFFHSIFAFNTCSDCLNLWEETYSINKELKKRKNLYSNAA